MEDEFLKGKFFWLIGNNKSNGDNKFDDSELIYN